MFLFISDCLTPFLLGFSLQPYLAILARLCPYFGPLSCLWTVHMPSWTISPLSCLLLFDLVTGSRGIFPAFGDHPWLCTAAGRRLQGTALAWLWVTLTGCWSATRSTVLCPPECAHCHTIQHTPSILYFPVRDFHHPSSLCPLFLRLRDSDGKVEGRAEAREQNCHCWDDWQESCSAQT